MESDSFPSMPMHYGTEKEYKLALDELRWLKKLRGQLTAVDLASTANKYRFPIDFLEKGLKGLSTEDYMIRTSRWFPVVYAWAAHRKAARKELFDAYIAFVGTSRRFAIRTAITLGLLFDLVGVLMTLQILDIIELILLVVLPSSFFAVTFIDSLWTQVAQKKEKMNDMREKIRLNGYDSLVEATDSFFAKYSKALLVTGGKTLEREVPELVAYQIGTMPDGTPIAIAENPDQSYDDRRRSLREST